VACAATRAAAAAGPAVGGSAGGLCAELRGPLDAAMLEMLAMGGEHYMGSLLDAVKDAKARARAAAAAAAAARRWRSAPLRMLTQPPTNQNMTGHRVRGAGAAGRPRVPAVLLR